MTTADKLVVCGRSFTPQDLDSIREIIGDRTRAPNRRQISLRVCEVLEWRRPDGRLKEMSCRVALLRLERAGLIRLPPARFASGNRKSYQAESTIAPPVCGVPSNLSELEDLRVSPVQGKRESSLWNEAVSRFHYLGYRRLPGAQMRYLIRHREELLGVLGFGASAWKVASRDQWIGWTIEQRKLRLHLVINNARFLILPWVRVPNLASRILSHCARRLPDDWEERYRYRPVLLETFVDTTRFRGTCYAAANWRYVGETKGRGKLDRHHRCELPVKRIYLYPLSVNFREVLCS